MRETVWSVGTALTALAVFALLSVPDLGTGLVPGVRSGASADPVAQTALSRVGAAGAPGLLASSFLSHLFLAVGFGSPVDRLGSMALLAGALSVFLVVRLYRRLGLEPLPAVVGAGVVAGGGTALSLVTSGSPDVLVMPLLLGLLLSGLWWAQTHRHSALATHVALTVITVGSYPVTLAVVMVIVGVQWMWVRRAKLGWGPLALTLAAAGGGLVHRVGAAGLLVTSDADSLAPFGLGLRSSGFLDAFGAAVALLTDELGLLGGLLAGVGALALVRGRRPGWLVCAAALLTLIWTGVSVSATPFADQAALMLLVWLPSGVGLQWALTSSPTRSSQLGVAAVGVLLAAANLVRHEGRVPWFADPARTEHAEQLLHTVTGAWIVTDHRALDRGAGVRTGASGGGLLPLDAGVVRRTHGRGDPTFAFEQGRQRLERFGLQFEPVSLPPTLVPLRHFLQSLPRQSVVAAVAGPEFIRMVGPGADSGFGLIGAVGPSFGARGVYAVVGVVRGGGAAVERAAADRVVLDIDAGDPHPHRPRARRADTGWSGARVVRCGGRGRRRGRGFASAAASRWPTRLASRRSRAVRPASPEPVGRGHRRDHRRRRGRRAPVRRLWLGRSVSRRPGPLATGRRGRDAISNGRRSRPVAARYGARA